jgi:serine/threonine protein kinase
MELSNKAVDQAMRCGSPRVWTGLVLNDNYRIGSLIEQGSTFELYEGTQLSTNDRICLKILLPQLAADPASAVVFFDEARIIGRISHPGLVRYRACARDPQSDLVYVVMDSPGPRLSARLAGLRPSPQEIAELMKRLASVLAAAHSSGLVHGHLSPANIMLPKERLADAAITGFNLIKTAASSAFDRATGDVEYLAPEQVEKRRVDDAIGPWTDIYSVALVCLAAWNGVDGSRDVSRLPRGLRRIFIKMLEFHPAQRFRSMDDVVEALDGISLDASRPTRVAWLETVPRAAAKRISVALGAVLIAASPWLLQTSVPQLPADARPAAAVQPLHGAAGVSVLAAPGDAAASESHENPPAPGSVPLPIAKPKLPAARLAQSADREMEAEQTARLNAEQMQLVTNSSDDESEALRDLGTAADAVIVEMPGADLPAPPPQTANESGDSEVPRQSRPSGSSIDQYSRGASEAEQPLDEQAIAAQALEERVRAGNERRLREWCKAQRRRCTFPARP